MLSETEPIIIKTFGTFSVSQGDHIVSETDNRSKKLWKLLEYIVHNRHRKIYEDELITLLWGDMTNSEGCASSLKTLLHRMRNTLAELGFEESRHMVLRQGKYCFWNNHLPLRIDTDDFVHMAELAQRTDEPEEKLNAALRAMSQYKGRYLGGKYADEDWAKQAADRYHNLYLYCYNAAIHILTGEEQYDHVIFLSRHAMELDPAEESFYYNEISALITKGEGTEALVAYERALNVFYEQFRKTPSERLRALYRGIARPDNGIEPDLSIVREHLEAARSDRPIRCEYDTFCLLYSQTPKGMPHRYLVLLTVLPNEWDTPPLEDYSLRAFTTLERSLEELLHVGDVYTRYSLSQLLALVNTPSEDELYADLQKMRSPFANTRLVCKVTKI